MEKKEKKVELFQNSYSWAALTLRYLIQTLDHAIYKRIEKKGKKTQTKTKNLFILINIFLWSSFWKAKEFLMQALLFPLPTVL